VRPWLVVDEARHIQFALVAESPEAIWERYPDVRVFGACPPDIPQELYDSWMASAPTMGDGNIVEVFLNPNANRRRVLGPVRGTVKWSNSAKGVGAISCDETAPWDIWFHFHVIDVSGYRNLDEGQTVDVEYEQAPQDSFRYRAVKVVPVRRAR